MVLGSFSLAKILRCPIASNFDVPKWHVCHKLHDHILNHPRARKAKDCVQIHLAEEHVPDERSVSPALQAICGADRAGPRRWN